ncbi:MAG TPA: lipopolysaccharide biosynthesis protein [Prolixibacteraceae bacterium]|nr:lipopolysaccharide biosynthesis protein [Prolixibacteraceae bacterium]
MSGSLKDKTITGMLWSSVHRFATMLISFIANLVMARILSPEDFGIIGMLMVFIATANILVDGGFASALIQKKEPTNADYSTIFYCNIIIACILFVVLYIFAPAIAEFYRMPQLSSILRTQGLILIFNAFSIIQTNQLIKQLNFKSLANTTIIATTIGATVGITFALMGFGVWSLVVQMLITSITQSLILWGISAWRPMKGFSWQSFKNLSNYGSYILLTNLLWTFYENIQILIIGRIFSAKDLGFFTQANKLVQVPVTSLSAIVNQVTFPVFSQLQDDFIKLKSAVRKSLKSIVFINFPLMSLLFVMASPLFTLLLTEKWASSVPMFQILCIGGMFWTINTANSNIFKSLGRSDIYFKVQTIKVIMGSIMIVIGIQFGLTGILYAIAGNSYLFFLINAHFTQKLLSYSTFEQLKDIAIYFLLSIIAGALTFMISLLFNASHGVMLILQASTFLSIYVGFAYLLKLEAFQLYYDIIANKIKR